jgi:hypothetical protein
MTLGSIVANSISGIGVLNEMQVSAYESIIAGLEDSTTATAHTLAGSVLLADESARELAQWYKDGNERIAQRLSPDQSATVASVPTPLMVAESPAPEVPTIQFITEPEVLGQETERMPQLEVREIYVDVAEGALAADTGERPPVVITVEKDHVSNMNICINESCYYSAAQ